MSAPGTSAFRMRSAAAASSPKPPPTICAFICFLLASGLGISPLSPLSLAPYSVADDRPQERPKTALPFVAARSGQGLLTEPIAGAQVGQRELVILPLFGHRTEFGWEMFGGAQAY